MIQLHTLVYGGAKEVDLTKIISYVMLAVLGIMCLFLVVGAIYGVVRGGKRSLIRLITVLVGLSVALLITPLFSGMLMNMTLPFVGETAGELVEGFLFNSGIGADIATAEPEIVAFVKSCAAVIINFIMFIILFLVFQLLTWIIYTLVAMKLAPKNKKIRNVDADGVESFEKVKAKKGRWWGLGVGVITGFVFCAFFMIPVTGVMQTLDKAASYKPTFASFSATSVDDATGDDMIMDVYNTVHDINGQVQTSLAGKLTKYTGLQMFGGWCVGYLGNIKSNDTKVNVKNDLVKFVQVAKDGVAVMTEFNREGDMLEKMQSWTNADYKELQNIIDRIFDIGLVNMTLGYMDAVTDVLQDNAVLDDVAGGLYTDPGFINAVYDGLRTFTMPQELRNDLKSVIEIARLVFAQDQSNFTLYGIIKSLIDNFDDPAALEETCEVLSVKLSGNNSADIKDTHAYAITKTFFNMNLIQSVLAGENLKNLYQIPLADVLELDPSQIEIAGAGTNWDDVSKDAAQLLINIVNTIPEVMKVMNATEPMNAISEINVEPVGAILDTLTNSSGIGKLVRTLVCKFAGDLTPAADPDAAIDVGSILNALIAKIDPASEEFIIIDWTNELKIVQEVVVFVQDLDPENIDTSKVTAMLTRVAQSKLFADIFTDTINKMMGDIMGADGLLIQINDLEGAAKVLEILTDGFDAVLNGGLEDVTSIDELLELLDIESSLNALAELCGGEDGPPIVIDISEMGEGIDTQIIGMLDNLGLSDTDNEYINILKMFGFTV